MKLFSIYIYLHSAVCMSDSLRLDLRALNDVLGGFSLTLIDSLGTLAIMGKQDEFEKAVRLIIKNVHFDLDARVQVFEVTIRVLGGLLSAHLLALDKRMGFQIDWYQGELLIMATDLANRLMPAFDTPSGLPFPRVNLRYGVIKKEVREACTAGAGTLVLEFGVLSRLTGDSKYEKAAKKSLFEVWNRRSSLNLVGMTMNLFDKKWSNDLSGVGASSDSFFEYLFKAHILLGGTDYLPIFDSAYQGILEWIRDGEGFVYKNVNMNTGQLSTVWVDSLAAFFPGLQVLYGDLENAFKPHFLYFTIWKKYNSLPERFDFQKQKPVIGSYPLRPELIESTYMLYQATKSPFYLYAGKMLLEDIERYNKVKCGYAAMEDVQSKKLTNRMESFFLSETLKYLFLLFDTDNIVNTLDTNAIFTTEGHFMPLPHNLTIFDHSAPSSYHICPNFGRDKLVRDNHPPLDDFLITRVRNFVGLRGGAEELSFKESESLTPFNVELSGARVGNYVFLKNMILIDSLRGYPLTIISEDEGYSVLAIDGVSKGDRIIRTLAEDVFNQPKKAISSNLDFLIVATIMNEADEMIEIYGEPAVFGSRLYHGFQIQEKTERIESKTSCHNYNAAGKIVIVDAKNCNYYEKATRAMVAGARAVVILIEQEIEDRPEEEEFWAKRREIIGFDVDPLTIPAIFLSRNLYIENLLPVMRIATVLKDLVFPEAFNSAKLLYQDKEIMVDLVDQVQDIASNPHPKMYQNDFRPFSYRKLIPGLCFNGNGNVY